VNRNRSTPSPTEELLTATSYESEAEPPPEDSHGEASSTWVRGRPLDPEARSRFLDLISAVGARDVTLDEALESVLSGLGDVLHSPVVRIHRPGSAGDRWRIEPGLEIDQARDRLDGKLEIPDTLQLKAVSDLPDWKAMDVFRSAGLHGVATLPVFAEGQAVAAVQLFTDRVLIGGEVPELLGILTTQLGLNASLGRMRGAVRNVAQHARTMIASMEELREHSELYDSLTGLPGTPILKDRIRQSIRGRRRSSRRIFAVLLVQAEGLPRVRDAMGGERADEVLLAAARRLAGLLRPADTVARSGDRLITVLEEIRVAEEAKEVADRILAALQRPFPVGSTEVKLDPAIGLVFGGPAYDTVDAILGDAEIALGRARESKLRVQFFDAVSDGSEERRRQIEAELAGALQRKDFFLEYQPIVSLEDGSITGLEAFIRWRHAEMGIVPPNVFIPVAVASPLIHQLGYWVIERTCQQIRLWQDNLAPQRPPPVAINVAGRQLFHKEFAGRVRDILERNGVIGEQVRFDISETDLMKDPGSAERVLGLIQEMGIQVAVDDFGTGYSSLSLLHTLPVHALKIDRSFVSRSQQQLRRGGVARTIVMLAKNLEIDVIAEGIETRQQFVHLRATGCVQAQGFYFSGPVGPPEVESLIRHGYPLNLEATG
jgi:diguanylate cyclase (GGDEF)-like protein